MVNSHEIFSHDYFWVFCLGIPWQSFAEGSVLPLQGLWIVSLVRELRSYMQWDTVKVKLLSVMKNHCFILMLLQTCSCKSASSWRRFMGKTLTSTGLVLKSTCLHVWEAVMHLPSTFPSLLAQSHIMSWYSSPISVSFLTPHISNLYGWYNVNM